MKDKLIVPQVVEELLVFYVNRKFVVLFTRDHQWAL
jgi:hypothetical protein